MKFADFVFYCLENNFENADLSKKQRSWTRTSCSLVPHKDVWYSLTQYIPDKPQLLIFMSPRVRSNYGKETFKFAVTKIWEKIPTNMKTLTLL